MSPSEIADITQAVAALATFATAVLAVVAAYRAPKLAAEFAEHLRLRAEADGESRKMKMWVFTTLLQQRASIASLTSVQALNAIDVAFAGDNEVRAAWKHFLEAANQKPFDPSALVERHKSLLEKMARALGMGGSITVTDIQDAYYPELLGNLDRAILADAHEKLQRLEPAGAAPTQPPTGG